MSRHCIGAAIAVWSLAVCVACAQDYPVKPVPFTEVHIDDDFWSPRLETSRRVTVPACFTRCEETGRIDNFAVAGGLMEGIHRGARYGDSDLYKVMQGAAYLLSLKTDSELDRYLDDIIAKIAAAQEDKPVIEQTTPHGHVVRATYMYCGMADIAALTGDTAYIEAIDAIWENIVSKRLYLIGSMGVRGYAEGFGPDYKLPNMEAYNETCATIGTSFLNLRLFLLHKDARYIDVLERSLYNGVLAAVSLEGDEFFYPNPLATDGVEPRHVRKGWYGTACCPSNMARFMPSVPGYVYAHDGDDLYVNLFIGGRGRVAMDGRVVNMVQKTEYPWDGKVTISVEPEASGRFDILVRIPGWTQNRPVPSDLYRYLNTSHETVSLEVNGKPVALDTERGFVRIRRNWSPGDQITLDMPMPIRRVLSHEKVEDNAGRVAIERGPVIYCAEWVDNSGEALDLVLTDDVTLKAEYAADMLGGITLIKGTLNSDKPFKAIPYYAWGNRGRGPMNVWLKRQ